MAPVEARGQGNGRPELRSARRLRVRQQAKIVFDPEVMIHCEVRDISTGGARIALQPSVTLPETFEIYIAAHSLRVHTARLRWRNGHYAGIAFASDDPPMLEDTSAARDANPPAFLRLRAVDRRQPEAQSRDRRERRQGRSIGKVAGNAPEWPPSNGWQAWVKGWGRRIRLYRDDP